jgi:hypothetical protein
MIFSRKSNLAFSAALAIACFGTLAVAQNRPPPPPGAPAAGPAIPGVQGRDALGARVRDRMDRRAMALHNVLDIRPDQEAAFQAYETAMKPDMTRKADFRRGGPRAAQPEAATTPERLDRMSARMTDMQKAFAARAAAIKTFYAVLSPDQKHTFDSLPSLEGDRGVMKPGRDRMILKRRL